MNANEQGHQGHQVKGLSQVMEGFVVTVHEGAWEQEVQIWAPQANGSVKPGRHILITRIYTYKGTSFLFRGLYLHHSGSDNTKSSYSIISRHHDGSCTWNHSSFNAINMSILTSLYYGYWWWDGDLRLDIAIHSVDQVPPKYFGLIIKMFKLNITIRTVPSWCNPYTRITVQL